MPRIALLPRLIKNIEPDTRFEAPKKDEDFEIVYPPEPFNEKGHFIWNQPPEEYAQHIMNVLTLNPPPDIIHVCGGAGTQETVYYLHKHFQPEIEALAKRVREGTYSPPALIGFSDAIHLMNYLGGMGVVTPYALSFALSEEEGRKELKRIVTAKHKSTTQSLDLIQLNPSAKGVEKGVSTTVPNFNHGFSSQFSHFADKNHGNILFMETAFQGRGTENAEGLRKALEQLKQQGYLDKITAIVLPITDANGDEQPSIEALPLHAMQDVINDVIGDKLPVYFGSPIGHNAEDTDDLNKLKAIPLFTQTRVHHKEVIEPINGQPVRRVTMELDMRRSPADYEVISAAYKKQLGQSSTFPPQKHLQAVSAISAENSGPSSWVATRLKQCPMLDGCLAEGLRGAAEKMKQANVMLVYSHPYLASEENKEIITDGAINDLQMTLSELLLRGELQQLRSLVIALPEEPEHQNTLLSMQKQINAWVQRFQSRHGQDCPPVQVKLIPPAIAAQVPDDRAVALTLHMKRSRLDDVRTPPKTYRSV